MLTGYLHRIIKLYHAYNINPLISNNTLKDRLSPAYP